MIEWGARIQRLKMPERDGVAGVFSVRLEVEQQHGEATAAEEPCPSQHLQPVRAYATQEEHRSTSTLPGTNHPDGLVL
jgi:hypothetical protein